MTVYYSANFSGTIASAIKYTSTPGTSPVIITANTQISRRKFESMCKYSASPPHTPVNTLSVLLLYSFLCVRWFIWCVYNCVAIYCVGLWCLSSMHNHLNCIIGDARD